MLKTTITARRVTISQTVKVHETLSIFDYTDNEINAAWYDADEVDRITARCFKLINQFENGNSRKYCIRGLEGHTTLGSITKRSNRSAAYTAVFEAQNRLWDETEDVLIHAISYAYLRISSSCQMWAQVVGKRDEKAVERYVFEENEDDVLCSKQQLGKRLVATKDTEFPLKPTESIHASSFGGQLPTRPKDRPFDPPGARAA